MSIFTPNKPAPSDVIPSTTLNLTKMTTWIAAALGAATTVSSIAARNDEGTDTADWLGFDQEQRFVIVVALIAAVAVIHAADLLARAIATARSTSTTLIPLPTVTPAKLTVEGGKPGEHRDGHVLALRPDGRMLFHHNEGDLEFEWVIGSNVTMKR